MKLKEILSFTVLSVNLFLVGSTTVESGKFFSKVSVAKESDTEKEESNKSEITLDILEQQNDSCEAFFTICYKGKIVVAPDTVWYNDIVCWEHKNKEVKIVEKVKDREDIYALDGRLDLAMQEKTLFLERHKVLNVVSSFIRVSLHKMLTLSNNNKWNGVNPFVVYEGTYTAKMVKALEDLFCVLEGIQSKSGKESKWLLCAKNIFSDLRSRMKIIKNQVKSVQGLVYDFE